jgi:hypothetical protein
MVFYFLNGARIMDIVTPYAGASEDRLTALINQDNMSQLQLGVDFTFGLPSSYSDAQGRNTQVVITPVPGANYAGPETLHYVRLPLTVLEALPEGFIQTVQIPALPFRLSDLLDSINTALGLNLAADEIVDQQFVYPQTSYPLPINQSLSLAWIDSDYEFPANVENPVIQLDSVITQRVLSEMVYTGPT